MPDPNLSHLDGVPNVARLNAIVDALRAVDAFSLGGGGTSENQPTGRVIAFRRRSPFWAQITGGTNPYSWNYVARTSSGWTTIANGGTTTTAPAYELNARTDVPSGRVVQMREGYQDDFRFLDLRRGGGGTTICIVACYPAIPVYGALVQVYTSSGGTLVASCTTGSSGCCSVPVTGSYYVTVTDAYGTVVYSGTQTLSGTVTIAIGDTNYVCCGGYLIPKSLTLTDASGSYSFVYQGVGGGLPTWACVFDITAMSTPLVPNGSPYFPTCKWGTTGSGPISICYSMTCNSSSTPSFTLQRTWNVAYPDGVTPGYFQDSPLVISGWPQCFCGGSASCNGLGNVCNFSVCSVNPTTGAPFALSCSPTPNVGNVTSDPLGSVAISA